MTFTPAVKGLLTKAVKAGSNRAEFAKILRKAMPREQAKHAARKYYAMGNGSQTATASA